LLLPPQQDNGTRSPDANVASQADVFSMPPSEISMEIVHEPRSLHDAYKMWSIVVKISPTAAGTLVLWLLCKTRSFLDSS
jgi:hypothetical protein